MSISIDQVHRYTLDEYHQLIESRAFEEDVRAELIDGLLVDLPVKSPEHEAAVRWLNRYLVRALDPDRFDVGVGSPLTLEPSEPEPDFFVVRRGSPQPFHYSTAELVVEVSFSSLRHDLMVKSRVYARARIPEYWVVDIEGERVVCQREPVGDGYRDMTELRAGERLVTDRLELPPLDVGELLAVTRS